MVVRFAALSVLLYLVVLFPSEPPSAVFESSTLFYIGLLGFLVLRVVVVECVPPYFMGSLNLTISLLFGFPSASRFVNLEFFCTRLTFPVSGLVGSVVYAMVEWLSGGFPSVYVSHA